MVQIFQNVIAGQLNMRCLYTKRLLHTGEKVSRQVSQIIADIAQEVLCDYLREILLVLFHPFS